MSPSSISIMCAGVSWCPRAPELAEASWSGAEWRCVRGSERRQWQTLVSMAADQEAMFHGRDVTMPPRDWMVEAIESTNNYTTNYISTSTILQTTINSDTRCMFLGSRTSFELCECNLLMTILSRQCSEVADAQYTKDQSWKSAKNTLGMNPVKEVSLESRCQYKYLFNYRGEATNYSLCSTTQVMCSKTCSLRCMSSRRPPR